VKPPPADAKRPLTRLEKWLSETWVIHFARWYQAFHEFMT
jgi:hypothetical protein